MAATDLVLDGDWPANGKCGASDRTSPISKPVWGCPPFAHRASWIEGDRHRGQSVDNPADGVATVRRAGWEGSNARGRGRRRASRPTTEHRPLSIRTGWADGDLADRTFQPPYDVGSARRHERGDVRFGIRRDRSPSNRAMAPSRTTPQRPVACHAADMVEHLRVEVLRHQPLSGSRCHAFFIEDWGERLWHTTL